MKVATNFDIREFVPKSIWDRFGTSSVWFINKRVINLAQFYKDFFTKYYKNQLDNVKTVLIVVNTWHYIKGGHQYRGFRPPAYTKGAKLSQHRFGKGFDCDIIIVFEDGTRQEVNYSEIHDIINEYEEMFIEAGLTTLESVKDAPTWLHSDCRWIINQVHILTVGV
jgi:hypothetical protein